QCILPPYVSDVLSVAYGTQRNNRFCRVGLRLQWRRERHHRGSAVSVTRPSVRVARSTAPVCGYRKVKRGAYPCIAPYHYGATTEVDRTSASRKQYNTQGQPGTRR